MDNQRLDPQRAGLHVFRSNRLERLARSLAAELRRAPPDDPFLPVEIVVGSRGMERHLRHVLAGELGICANVVCPFPSAAIDALLPALAEGVDPWSPDALAWVLVELLPSLRGDPGLAPLDAYLGPDPGALDARWWTLLRRLADLFDRYVTYRGEEIEAWASGVPSDLPEDLTWQVVLWRALAERLAGVPHRRQRIDAAMRAPAEAGEPLRLFGLASLPPAWWALLAHVAERRRVEVYLLAPSDEWWEDLRGQKAGLPPYASLSSEALRERMAQGGGLGEAAHPLLASWGRVARDAQALIEEIGGHYHDHASFEDPLADGSTALRWLQHDLMRARVPSLDPESGWADRVVDAADASVQLHSTHGPMRQVEVLRDVLLELLERDPTIQPRDIVVMTPDVEAFAPLVGAVFDEGEVWEAGRWGASGMPRLPWEVTDRSLRRMNPVAEALLALLEMARGRVVLSGVLDWLALEPVQARFGLGVDEVQAAHTWLAEAGVRWGADAADRAAADQPADEQNTWSFGLERLLMGLVSSDEEALVAGVRPQPSAEGAGAGSVGRVVQACVTLLSQLDRLRGPRPVARWVQDLSEAVEATTRVEGGGAWLGERVREVLVELAKEAEGTSVEVSLDGIVAVLTARFEVAASGIAGPGGAITLCGMVPERAVPYRVVVWLGMDEGAFPRAGTQAAYDLLARRPRLGDRDARAEDRFLLLEALLSARDHLVVLWSGRDVHTNEVRPPAVPVAELIDALDGTFPLLPGEEPLSKRWHREHPLQGFDVRCFDASAPWSHDGRLLRALRQVGDPVHTFMSGTWEAEDASSDEILELADLLAFWRHPTRAWMRARLGLALPWSVDEAVEDREPLEVDARLKTALVEQEVRGLRVAEGAAIDEVLLRASGVVPAGRLGDREIARIGEGARMVVDALAVHGVQPGACPADEVDGRVRGVRLVGRVVDRHGGLLVRVVARAPADWMLLQPWIEALALRSQGVPVEQVAMVGLDKGAVKRLGLQLPEPEVCRDALSALVKGWQLGRRAPIPVYRGASEAWAKNENEGDALDAALMAWEASVGKDLVLRHAFGTTVPFLRGDGSVDPAFIEWSEAVYHPVFLARTTDAPVKRWRVS